MFINTINYATKVRLNVRSEGRTRPFGPATPTHSPAAALGTASASACVCVCVCTRPRACVRALQSPITLSNLEWVSHVEIPPGQVGAIDGGGFHSSILPWSYYKSDGCWQLDEEETDPPTDRPTDPRTDGQTISG